MSRGVIDGEVLAVIADRAGLASSVFERVAGALGDDGRERLRQLRAASAAERSRQVATVLATVSSPLPASLRAVHPDWLEAALAEEPEARAVLAQPSLTPAAAWLARRAFGGFPRTAATAAGAPEALRWLRERGAAVLAVALDGRRPAVAAALAQLGTAGEWLAAAEGRRERGLEAPLDRRAAIAACHGLELARPLALERLGVASSSAELVAEAPRWRALCHFLPRALGLAIAAQLEGAEDRAPRHRPGPAISRTPGPTR